jgi:GntR family transcriptional regulator
MRPYQRLQVGLATLISATPPGQRLPSEPDLARQLGVSRATLREAMRSFEGQGLIRRKQGVGTFVTGHTQVIETGLEVLESIETLAHHTGLLVSMGALEVDQIQADKPQAHALNIPVGSTLVRVARTILADKRPVAYLVDLLPEDILTPGELHAGFTGSVLDLLLRKGEPPLSSSRTEISAVAATPELARALGIQRSDVLLQFTATLLSLKGRIIDYSYSYFLPGYFRFHVNRNVGGSLSGNRLISENEEANLG